MQQQPNMNPTEHIFRQLTDDLQKRKNRMRILFVSELLSGAFIFYQIVELILGRTIELQNYFSTILTSFILFGAWQAHKKNGIELTKTMKRIEEFEKTLIPGLK